MVATTLILLQLLTLPVQDVALAEPIPPADARTLATHLSEPCPIGTNHFSDIQYETVPLDDFRTNIEQKVCTDPDTKIAFVHNVIESNATDHFTFAQQIYFEVLRETPAHKRFGIIEIEAINTLPLVPEEQKSEWKTKIESKDKSLAHDIAYFWSIRDPVRSTQINERLSEHWQRIAHARKNYTKNTDGLYGTDDRGTIFVRYGKPTIERSGLLSPSNTEIRSKLYDLSFFKGGIDPRELYNLNMSIKQQYMPKYYEVWVYRNIEKKQPLIFIFGESANKGTFGLRKSLEDFIPNGSFNMGISSSWRYDTGPRGLTAGPFLQMALYDRLSTIDIFFGKQLASYEDNWMKYMRGHLNFNSFKMISRSPQAEMALQRLQDRAPESNSTMEERLNLISQHYKSYRFLDEENNPYRKLVLFSNPHNNLISYDAVISQHQKPVYKLTASVDAVNREGRSILIDKQETFLRGDLPGTIATLLSIPKQSATASDSSKAIMISSEVSRIPQLKGEESEADRYILASAVSRIQESSPLNSSSDKIEVSDIIWGYRGKEKTNQIEEFHFIIPPDDRLPQGENLAVYFETYHLNAGTDSLYQYQVEYSIHRKKRRKLRDTGIRLTLNLSSASDRGSENIEIQTADLETGSYRAVFRFLNPEIPGTTEERYIDFQIEDQP
ncbi:GWxTD domain-containing protein [Balneolaceae bacterium YR4-1]|uniref:GWxTD domain-containing protein n=1 Tax=Halalkalibaculum roseum TaxID=2709311 RepID=A0A6M1SYK9_9BACT|nr:GWxTD domain-containing protein [Halalkalibaculum roseum]NGP77046.1 GWxTD domain-containing protein [Halalkalibaculum roseum]